MSLTDRDKVIRQRGYLVMGSEFGLKPGELMRSLKYSNPESENFYVIERTLQWDMLEQIRLWKEWNPSKSYSDGKFEYYYRVERAQQSPPTKTSWRIGSHCPPDRNHIEENREVEPLGEQIRQELEDWIRRNKIVSVMLDTEKHCVSVDIAKLPPRIKPVLTRWGSIFIEDDGDDPKVVERSCRKFKLEDGEV